MNNILKNYEDFRKDEQSKNENTNQSAYMAKYSSSEFKNMLSDRILEKDEFLKEDKINKIHAAYELEMLYESKSHWDKTSTPVHYLEFGSHILLVKESEGFLIEKKTFKLAKSGGLKDSQLLEEWSWRDFVPDFIEKGIDAISDGAQKVMKWVEKAKAAVKEFIHHNHKAISLVLSILTAVFGIIGIAVPGFSVAGGVCMILNGIMHISHGWEGFQKGRNHLAKASLESGKNLASLITVGLPGLLSGGLMILLGANDVWQGSTTAMTPAGAAAAVHSEVAKKTGHQVIEKAVTSVGHYVEHTIEHVIEYVTENVVPDAVKFAGDTLMPEAAKAMAAGSLGVISIYLHAIFTKIIGWLYDGILQAAFAVASALTKVVELPAKISKMISDFSDGAEGFLQNLISVGLNSIVKPMTDCIAGFIEEHVTPGIESVKTFITGQQLAVHILDNMKSKKPNIANEIESINVPAIPKPTQKLLPEAEPVKLSEDDREKIKDIAKKGAEMHGEKNDDSKKETKKEELQEVGESRRYKYLKDFRRFES